MVHSVIRTAALGGVAMLALVPAVAGADVPSYADRGPQAETIRGTVYAFTGRYTLTLEDERGFEDSVTLHDGTVITPTGLTLGAGQVATITGHTDGKTFDADAIDIDPATISTGQALLPASDYALAYGSQFPGYAFGYNATAFGIDGFVGPYGGYGGNVYGGYYGGGGGYSYANPAITAPNAGANPGTTVPIARRPVTIGPVGAPPNYRYPTGYRGANPIVRPGAGSQPHYRSAPQAPAHVAPQGHAAPAASSRR